MKFRISHQDCGNTQVKLNLGCGSRIVKGWLNVDYALGARIAKVPLFRTLNRWIRLFNLDWDERIVIHNLTCAFPWRSGSVQVIYTSHLLEHMTRDQGRFFLKECHRVLCVGGVIRIVVPDLEWYVGEYQSGTLTSDYFLERLDVLYGHKQGAFKRILAPYVQFPHKCMYDKKSLMKACGEVGFVAGLKGPYQSQIDEIEAVELLERTEHAVVVEGIKVAGGGNHGGGGGDESMLLMACG